MLGSNSVSLNCRDEVVKFKPLGDKNIYLSCEVCSGPLPL